MKKRRWLWIISTLLLVLLLMGVGSFFVTAPNHPSMITRENFDRVQEGMTEAEAEAILGPQGDYSTRPVIVFVHGVSYRRWWVSDDGVVSITVRWDDGDRSKPSRIATKHFHPWPPETYGERWQRQLGL